MRLGYALASIGVAGLAGGGLRIDAQSTAASSAGPQAGTCGNPVNAAATAAEGGPGAEPIFPPGQYPVQLPQKSLLGASNDLPNPFQTGVDWGQLPPGRTWGSTASVTTAPDGTIWVADRCGKSGAGGELCNGASSGINPIFQFDTSGRLLKSFGAGMFTSPHKLTIDADGNLWMADNGQHQVMKLDSNGKLLMTLGKKGVAGAGNDQFDAPTEVAAGPNWGRLLGGRPPGGGAPRGQARRGGVRQTGPLTKT